MASTSRAKMGFAELPPHLLGSDEASREALLLRLRIHSFLAPDDLLAEGAVKELVRRNKAGEPPQLDDAVRRLAKMLGMAPLMLLKMAKDVAHWVEHGEGDEATLAEDNAMQEDEGEEEEEWVGPTPDHERMRAAGDGGSFSVHLEGDVDDRIADEAGADEGGPPFEAGAPVQGIRSSSSPANARQARDHEIRSLERSQARAASQLTPSTAAARRSLDPSATQQQPLRTPSGAQHRSASALLAEMESEAVAGILGPARATAAGLDREQRQALPVSSGSVGAVFRSPEPSQRAPTSANPTRMLASQVLQQQAGQALADDSSQSKFSQRAQPRVVRTTLTELDRLLGIPDLNVTSMNGEELCQDRSEFCGLAPGSMVELTGPTGSGKTCLVTQISLQFRFDALVAAAAGAEDEGGKNWDDVVEAAASVWMIDTEGSLLPSRLHADAISFVASLSASCLHPFRRFFGDNESPAAIIKDELLLALLVGISLSRALTLAELIAHLTLAFPALSLGGSQLPLRYLEQRDGTSNPHTTASLIVIDSLSHHLRTPSNQTGGGNGGGSGSGNERGQAAVANDQSAAASARREATRQREERKQAIDMLRLLGQMLERWRRSHRNLLRQRAQALQRLQQDGALPFSRPPTPPPPPTLVTTMQMSTKIFSKYGELTNFRDASAVGRLVPSLVGPMPSASQQQQGSGRGGTSFGDEEESYLYGGQMRRRGTDEASSGGPKDDAEAAVQHGERGSVLGKEAWRIMLFREREGSRFAQIQGRPPYAGREHLSPFADVEAEDEREEVGQLRPYAEGDTTWKAWVRFDVDKRGRIVEVPLTSG